MKRINKVFISGPISNRNLYDAYKAFSAVERVLIARTKFTTPVNPMSMAYWGLSWETYMRISFAVLSSGEVDAVYMLQGWQDSRGARAERIVAMQNNIPVWYQSAEGWEDTLLQLIEGAGKC